MTYQLILYGTEGCHLCDEAQAQLSALDIGWVDVDIIDDDALMERYGTRIPVLQRSDTGAEIGWPFDHNHITALLRG